MPPKWWPEAPEAVTGEVVARYPDGCPAKLPPMVGARSALVWRWCWLVPTPSVGWCAAVAAVGVGWCRVGGTGEVVAAGAVLLVRAPKRWPLVCRRSSCGEAVSGLVGLCRSEAVALCRHCVSRSRSGGAGVSARSRSEAEAEAVARIGCRFSVSGLPVSGQRLGLPVTGCRSGGSLLAGWCRSGGG